MSLGEVKSRFRKDVAHHKSDVIDIPHENARRDFLNLPNELDLSVLDRRPHPWNSVDYVWTIRTGFDSNGQLVKHDVILEPANRP
jgi:hypothetical protein